MSMRPVLAASVVAVTLLAAIPAQAATVVTDPSDTRGVLDVRRVELRGDKTARWLVKTYDGWGKRRLQDRGFVLVLMDTFATKRFDYYALLRSEGRDLKGSLWRDRKVKNDVRVRSLHTSHPGRKIAGIRVGLKDLRKRQSHYRWQVETLRNGKSCPGVCFDRAPNSGARRRPFS